MKTERVLKNRKAVSPVIATVILVSVTIVVAVAVAYWMSGIAGIYTRFEKIEIESCSTRKVDEVDAAGALVPDGIDEYGVTIHLKNTGSADATVTNVHINGKVLTDYLACAYVLDVDGYPVEDLSVAGLTIGAGQKGSLRVYIPTDQISAGTTIEVKLHTAAGMDYPKLETLP